MAAVSYSGHVWSGGLLQETAAMPGPAGCYRKQRPCPVRRADTGNSGHAWPGGLPQETAAMPGLTGLR